jgi:hypothetical protein
MKNILCIILLGLFINSASAQCVDVYGTQITCPTESDSLVVYNNALSVYEFYEKNPDYVKLKTQRLLTRKDVVSCFYQLQDAVDSFTLRWQQRERVLNGEDLPQVLLPRDGKNIPVSNYYLYVDEYRFYQRELENGILNTASPFPIYDIRIAPLIINSYENRSGYEFNGDYVNVALYIPVTVKPYSMLTDSEKVVRQNIINSIIPKKLTASVNQTTVKPKRVTNKKIVNDTTLLESANINYTPPVVNKRSEVKYTYPPLSSVPVYYYTAYSGCLMGYMINRRFRKFLETDEFYWALPDWLKVFLKNNEELGKYLKSRFGSYYNGLYK